jgi:L-alanine-DL-glutamate epimerase-like enolase superfamily enzyme
MKIASIETLERGNLALVRVRTDDGAEGIGQTARNNVDITAMVLHRQVAPHVLGADPLDTQSLCDRVIEQEYKFPGTYLCRALAGVDTALWDLRGKLEGKSVSALLGSRTTSMPAYASSMRRDITPEDEVKRLSALRDAHGFRACKLKIGKRCGHDQDQWPGRTEALVAAVRRAMGDDFSILVDANSCYTTTRAIEVGRFLQDQGVCHFEEPCPYWEIEWTAEVAAALDVPVAAGEQEFHLPTWRRMFAIHAVDIAQPDVCYVGGFTRALRVAEMANQHGLPVTPHSSNRSLDGVFALHLLASIPNAGAYLEFGIEPNELTRGLYEPSLTVRDGRVTVPDAPGWGVTIDPAFFESAEPTVSEM